MRPRSQGRAISGRLEEKHCPMEGAESEVPRREILKKRQQRGRKDRKREKTAWVLWAAGIPKGASSGSRLNRPHQRGPCLSLVCLVCSNPKGHKALWTRREAIELRGLVEAPKHVPSPTPGLQQDRL